MSFDLQNTVAQLRSRLRELTKQRSYIEMQLVQVNLALSSLVPLIEDEKQREELLLDVEAARRKPGLTQAVSDCLRGIPHDSHSANELCVWLKKEGFDLSGYSQPVVAVSITLRRLVESGRVKAMRKNRRVTYQWIAD
jgi:hypothetical protein